MKFLYILSLLALVGCGMSGEERAKALEGVYRATETSESKGGTILPLRNLDLKLQDGLAEMLDHDRGIHLFKGSYSVKPATRGTIFDGADEVNIVIENTPFRPAIYHREGKIFYMDFEKEVPELTILSPLR